MTFRSAPTLALASAALLAACGGRSQLRDSGAASAGNGGSGGSGGNGGNGGSGPAPSSVSVSVSSGGGMGGAGGAGGAPGLCVVDGPPIGLAGTEGYNLSNPVLIAPEKVGLATLVAGWTAAKGPITPTELRHTSFDAWGAWPVNDAIGPSFLADYDGGGRFSAAPASGGFSLFFTSTTPPPGASPQLAFMSPLSPGSGMIPKSFHVSSDLAEPLFVTQSAKPDIHLMGFADSASAPHDLNLFQLTDPFSNQKLAKSVVCALDPIVAAAAPVDGGFLVASSSGSDFDDPACVGGGGPITAATRLSFFRVADGGLITPLNSTIDSDPGAGSIAAVKVVPSDDGAWVAWTHKLGNGSPILVVRINSTGTMLEGPFEVPFFGEPASLSAARLGNRLALAWTSGAVNAPPLVRVSVLGGSGVVADVTITLGPAATGRTALLGSPSGDALLVSWVEEVFSTRQLHTARISCSLP
jgi:hypothetical protein